jgi:hypothetical protein
MTTNDGMLMTTQMKIVLPQLHSLHYRVVLDVTQMKMQMKTQMKILLQKHPLHQWVLLLATTTNDGTLMKTQMKILLQKHPLHQRALFCEMTTNDGMLMTTQMKTHYF